MRRIMAMMVVAISALTAHATDRVFVVQSSPNVIVQGGCTSAIVSPAFVAQPVFVPSAAAFFAQPQFVVQQQRGGFGGRYGSRGGLRGGGGGGGALGSLFSRQGILTIGGAALGASIAGPLGAPAGAAIGAAADQIIGGHR